MLSKLSDISTFGMQSLYLLVRVFIDWYCGKNRYRYGVLFQLLAQLFNLFLDVPHFGHLAQHLCFSLNRARLPPAQSNRICEHELDKLETCLQVLQVIGAAELVEISAVKLFLASGHSWMPMLIWHDFRDGLHFAAIYRCCVVRLLVYLQIGLKR